MFPFLIGRIRTWNESNTGVHIVVLFPFLIGRIRTELVNDITDMDIKFPFLIGRIRTTQSIVLFFYMIQHSFHSS